MIFSTTVQGIPCQCVITEHTPYNPGRVSGPPEDCYEPEGGELAFHLLDRTGYLAPWLEKLMTAEDTQRIEEECLLMIEGEQQELSDF